MAGKKRSRGEVTGGAGSNSKNQNGNGSIYNKKAKKNNKYTKPGDNSQSMDNWIANLAKQSTASEPLAQSQQKQSTTKAERIEKRAAKQNRRQEKRLQKLGKPEDFSAAAAAAVSERRGDGNLKHLAATKKNHKDSDSSRQEQDSSAGVTTKKSKQQLKTLAVTCREAVKKQTQASKGSYRHPFKGYTDLTKKKRKKWDTDNIQPRPKDYGGLGLALPSLFLSYENPAFERLLEDEFQEHIDGFFGKQRTKAMKKQLDGKMLWRQMAKVKGTNKKIDGRKLADMTPDQRVEAMLKAGLL